MKKLFFLPCLLLVLMGCGESEDTAHAFDSDSSVIDEDPSIIDEDQTVAVEEQNTTSDNVSDILKGKEYVPRYHKHPNDYKPFSDEVMEDLEKLPENVQEYLLISASIHVLEPFVNDSDARAILLEAADLIPDFNSNDVDELIVKGTDLDINYEQRLEELLRYSN